MNDGLAVLLLAVACLVGLVLVPLGLPGLWVMVLGVIGYGALTEFRSVGVWTIGITLVLAFTGEIIESWVGFSYARKYGGSRRAGWGALVGGIVGAIVGVPVPVIGSVIGAFVGSFLGAALFEYSYSQRAEVALGAGWGAFLGRAFASAAKVALGLIITILGVVAVIRA